MEGLLEGIPIGSLSASALLGLTVFMLLTGKIVPRVTLNDKITEAEHWRQAYEIEREARVQADAQTTELLEVAKTTHSLIIAMSTVSERLRKRAEDSV